MKFIKIHFLSLLILLLTVSVLGQNIPLAEHPRPDFQRNEWQNLNGYWEFGFDSLNLGITGEWFDGERSFDKKILVPFPWGSNLSEVKDEADIAWYKRGIKVNKLWKGKRTFLTIGASDWETTVWLDGVLIGSHQGGYIPFSFEITDHIQYGQLQNLVIRVDDTRRDFALNLGSVVCLNDIQLRILL